MHLVTFSNRIDIVFSKTAGQLARTIDAQIPYIFSTNQFHKVIEANSNIRSAILRSSSLEPRLKPFIAAADGGGKSVVFFAGAGGYGDQLMTWPAVKALADRNYVVSVMIDPGNNTCWEQFPWVKAIHQLPLRADILAKYDYATLFELVTNVDEHFDQLHPTDNLLTRLGIDPKTMPKEKKVVKPIFSAEELAAATAQIGGRKIAIYQLTSSSVVRSLPPETSRNLALELAKKFPQFHWFATYDSFNRKEYFEPFPDCPKNLELKSFGSLRIMLAVAGLASLAVSTDSLLVHAAGVASVPCVGLWGSVDPSKRVCYYKNHLAVWQRQSCIHAPCYGGDPENFPRRCPPMENRRVCSVLDADARVVVMAAKKCLQMSGSV